VTSPTRVEIPDATPPERDRERDRGRHRDRDRDDRRERGNQRSTTLQRGRDREQLGAGADGGSHRLRVHRPRRKAGVRPGDLVGAIANESGLTGKQIGPIRISERHSVVGVPERSVDAVVAAMRHAVIRGRRPRSAATSE
jgi:ATP-dependent RNA helicase DeaD